MAEDLRLPIKLMNLDALRSEEDRLTHEIHNMRVRLTEINTEIVRRLAPQPSGPATEDEAKNT